MATSSDGGGPVTVSTGAVSVEKSFSDEEFPVPTVLFDLESTADEPLELRVTDEVPPTVEMSAVGFHPDYDGEAWTAYRDGRVQYETTLDPGESVRTVYGVRDDELVEPEAFASEPRVELLTADDPDGPVDEDDALDRETTRPVREVLAGEDGAPSAADVEAALGGSGDDSVRMPVVPGDDAGVSVGDPSPGDGSLDLDPPEDDGEETLAATLAAELRAGEVADEDVAVLRDHLGPAVEAETDPPTAAEVAAELDVDPDPDPGVPTSVEVRIDRLQATVDDLAAYTGALEEFLDEEGEGREAIEGFRAEAEAVAADVEAVRDTVDRVETRLDAMREDLDDAREAAETVDPEVESELDRLDDRVAAVDEETDDLGREVDRLDEFRERLNRAFGPDADDE
jgi:chaperonin cofactor prefoldin